MSAPAIIVVLPIESPAYAFLDCVSYGEERRLMLDYEHRDVLDEVIDAFVQLLGVLDDREGTS